MCRIIALSSALCLFPGVLAECPALELALPSAGLRRTGCISFRGHLAGMNGITTKETRPLRSPSWKPSLCWGLETWFKAGYPIPDAPLFKCKENGCFQKLIIWQSGLSVILPSIRLNDWGCLVPASLLGRKAVSRSLKILCRPFQLFSQNQLWCCAYLEFVFCSYVRPQ